MATKTSLTAAVLFGSMFWAGCAGHIAPGNDDSTGTGMGSDGGDLMGSGSDTGATPDDGHDPVYPTAHPRIYLTANRARLTASLKSATRPATRFKAIVDDWMTGDDVWGFRAWNAALLSQLTGNTTYCTKAITTVEAQVSAAETSIANNQAPTVADDSYLQIGDMIGDLALVYDWCFDQLTTDQRTRWLAYADQAVSNVWHSTTAMWGTTAMPWSGWATNDPSDNYYYQFTRATMLLGLASKGEDPQADTWIQQFRQTKMIGQLVPTFDSDLVGGGSREGTGYGVAMWRLFETYDWWKATTGESLAVKTPHTLHSMLAMLHQMVPTRDRIAPTGDQSRDSTASFFDYHRSYLEELIQLFPTDALAQRAKTQLAASSVPEMGSDFMLAYDFLYNDAGVTGQAMDGLNTSYYAPGIGELYARSGWDTHATWVNLIAGPYTQSHAHQDQGSLMLYKDGWLAYDAVIDSHSGLTQATTAHGLVRIDQGGAPVPQIASTMSNLLALRQGTGFTYAAADLTPAYDGNSAVQQVQREMVYLQPDVVVVFDRVTSAAGTTQTWQLASPVAASISGQAAAISNAGHTLHVQAITGGPMSVTSMPSVDADFAGGFRLDEAVAGGDNRFLHVLSIDGAAPTVTPTGDPAHPGVALQLAGGHTATVAFNRDSPGAAIVLDGKTVSPAMHVDSLAE